MLTLFSNPNSGQNRKNPKNIEKLRHILGGHGELKLPSTLAELRTEMEKCHQQNCSIVAINGGDGTVHQVLSAIHQVYGTEQWPKIAILRGGTINNLPTNLNIRHNAHKMLRLILDKQHNGEAFQLRHNRPLIVDKDKVGFLYGNGGIPHYLEAYYSTGNPTPLRAILVLSKLIASALVGGSFAQKILPSLNIQIVADNQPLTDPQFTMVGIGTVPSLGFRFRPFYHCLQQTEHCHMIAMTSSPLNIAFSLPNIWLARPTKRHDMHDILAKTIILRPDKPMLYTVDGDLYTCKAELEITVGPIISFIVG